MNLKFCPITDDYLENAADIYNYYVHNTTVTFHTEELSGEEMKSVLCQDDPLYLSLGIFDGEVLCGYVYMAPYKKRQAYRISSEVTIYLRPDYSGKGIGAASLSLLEEQAKKKGIHSFLAVICAENEASIKLFTKYGYIKCAHLREVGVKFDRMLDVVIFQKILE